VNGLFPNLVMCPNVRTNQTIASRADLETELSSLREALVRSNDVKELRVSFSVSFAPLVSRVASAMLVFVTILNEEIPILTPPRLEPVTYSLGMYS